MIQINHTTLIRLNRFTQGKLNEWHECGLIGRDGVERWTISFLLVLRWDDVWVKIGGIKTKKKM